MLPCKMASLYWIRALAVWLSVTFKSPWHYFPFQCRYFVKTNSDRCNKWQVLCWFACGGKNTSDLDLNNNRQSRNSTLQKEIWGAKLSYAVNTMDADDIKCKKSWHQQLCDWGSSPGIFLAQHRKSHSGMTMCGTTLWYGLNWCFFIMMNNVWKF